ncbi:related to conserved hypothetcial protein [Ustilago trichophora]|uniref:Related to conserved hypothetcial protein n=1 Tax=Ustilago trichophora TaxID=86804 RepID=A0A5C3EQ84_9BASI|nr:related to conserved hypothetcial protein [Ustilago trichophora]
MEHPSSSSSSNLNSPPRASDDQPQLNNAQSAPSSSDTQQIAPPPSSSTSASTSATASNSIPAHHPHPASSSGSSTRHPASSTSQTEAAPITTLWENFMARLRNVVPHSPPDSSHPAQLPRDSDTSAPARASGISDTSAHPPSPETHTRQHMESRSAQSTAEPAPASHPTIQRPHASDTRSDTDESGLPRPPVFFRLPFTGPDGNPALLAFHPQPLPRRESDPSPHSQPNIQRQSDSQPSLNTSPASPDRHGSSSQATMHPTDQPSANTSATSASPHSPSHPEGHIPISPLFVPFGASPLPFSFIYDANTQTAWPIAQVTPGSPPGGPSPDAPDSQQPRLVAGPPFRIILDIHFTAPPEPQQPDPELAAKYVKQLERADAELRARMARLGMGSIGGFADASSADDQDALLGCGVCLDNYEAEDRPEWIDGPRSQDEAVIAVPCPGHHTLHAGCLRDWLAKLPPSQWTCPFCRASLDPTTTHHTTQATSPPSSSSKSAATSSAPVHTTLREDVRARERQRGWRCDAPACLPRYPVSSHGDNGHLDLPETSDGVTTDLVKLTPCRHEVHLDCLCTSMRVENDLLHASDLDAIIGGGDRSSSVACDQNASQSADADVEEDERTTVGKWVTCPTCRKECWAELPLRKRPQRSAPDTSPTPSGQTASSRGSVKLGYDHGIASTHQMHETAAETKTSHVSDSIGRNQISGDSASNVADAAADPDEEAAVDALLVSS